MSTRRLLVLALCLLSFAFSPSAYAQAPVSGTVHSSDGAPIAGARVVVVSVANGPAATTDGSGRFTLTDVALPADLEISARGFETSRRTVTVASIDIVLAPATVTESVVVTADRPATWRDPETGTTVLAKSDLDQIPSVTADEALRVVSGFSLYRRSTSRNSNPTTQGVTLRGLSASGSSRGLVLLEGVPLNDGFGGWVTWTRVPPDAIARIDVDRGAEGEAVGTDALGGVVRIVAPRGDHLSAVAGGEAGSDGVGSVDSSIGGRIGSANAFGAVSWFHTDGTIPVAPEVRGPVDQPARANWANAFGEIEFGDGPRRLTFTGWGGSDDRGNGTVLQVNRMSGGTGAGSFDASGDKATLAVRVSVSPNRFYQTFTTVNAARTSEVLTSAQTTDGTTTRAVVEAGRSIPAGQLLASFALAHEGATFEDARATTTVTQALRDDTEAAAVQAGIAPTSRLTLTGGVRHEWRAAPTSSNSSDQATVGRVGASFELTRTAFIHGSVASSHRWPTLNELVRNFQVGNVLTKANPNLRPERAKSVDIAIGLSGARWLLSAGGFWTIVDDAVTNLTISSSPTLITRMRENAGDAHSRGLEVDGEIRPTGILRVRASASFADSRLRNTPEADLEGNRLPQVPVASGSLTIDLSLPHATTASLLWRGTSPQFDDDRNQFLLASASQFDLQVAGRLSQFRWYIVLENALDNRIETGRTPILTIAPGRAVRLGLTWLLW